MDISPCSARGKDRSQSDGSGNLILACGFGIGRLGFLQHAGFGSDFLAIQDSVVISTATATARAATAFATITTASVATVAGTIAATVTRTYATTIPLPDAIAGT